MNINELDSYNLGDAVKFNDKLNPRIWGADEKMRPEVREQLLQIAQDFKEFLGVDVEVQDITVSGSNAAYTYTPHSDIDLHLVVDLPRADTSEVYRELFDAKKYAYNDQHDIKIGDYDVELYVQDANKKHISQGIYSLVNNDWVSVPKRRKPDIDDISVRSKFEDLGNRIEAAVASGDYEKISAMARKLKDYRQAGLDAHGEFGPENLAFKILRTQGLIKKLYDARSAAKDDLLSLDERRKKKKKKSVKYGYGGYWYPGYAYAGQDHPAGTEGGDGGGDGGGESVKEDAGMTWDGVNPTTDMFTSEDAGMTPSGVSPTTAMFTTETQDSTDKEILQDFVDFCVKELKIESMPRVKLRRDPQWSQVHKTFGRYNDENKTLEVAWGQRHIMDVLRTVAHELTHKHQHEREGERMGPDAGETGSPYENEANARAGVLMRDYGRLHPEYFAVGQAHDLEEAIDQELSDNDKLYLRILDNIKYRSRDFLTVRGAGGGRSFTLGILAYLKQLQQLGKENVVKFIQQSIAQADQEDRQTKGMSYGVLAQALVQLADQEKDKTFANARKEYNKQKQSVQQGVEESASGYIPTKRQAKDPRFSMALTVDIKPGQVGKEANKLKLKTDRQGQPQIARANGLFENLFKEYQQYKADEDYSPDEPPGPEFKPTMPKGTVRVDVSDVYDWYKLGQHISNLKGLGKHDFGAGPPASIISFGDEDTEHKFIQDLKKTGLDVTDIDPVDPKQPKGMRKIKTDPTYNVDEGAPPPGLVVKKGGDWSELYPGGFQINAFLPNNKRVGMMVVYPQDNGWIGEHMVVDPEYQRQGIGTALWNFAEKTVGGRVIAINTTPAGKKFQRSRKQAVAEVIKMPPVNMVFSNENLVDWAYNDAEKKQARQLQSLKTDVPTRVYDMGDHLRAFVMDDQGPVLYLALEKYLDGFKTNAVQIHPRGQGKNLAFKVYQAVSDTFQRPLYSDQTHTDASRLGIWKKLIDKFPNRLVGYDQATREDLPLTATDQGPVVRGKEPIYVQKKKKDLAKPVTPQTRSRTRLLKFLPATAKQAVAEDAGGYPDVLYHGSTQEIKGPLTPRQANDIGGAAGSNKNAIYATDDPNFAIAYSLAQRGSDTGTLGWNKDPRLIFFGGKIRHGQNVYLHVLPTKDEQGQPLFTKGAADAEWYSLPNVKSITPLKVETKPVDQYLHLLRKPTPEEQKMFLANKAKDQQAIKEDQQLDEVKARYEMTDLDPWTFDQTPSGWRGLPNSARQADAINQYIETYVKNGQFVGAPEGAKTLRPYILYWHLGQVLLQMGRNGMAVGVMRQALDDGEAGWNAYVMATISFLRKDRRDFDHWAPLARGNEETIKRLTAGWGLPYKQAYAGQTLNEDQQLDEVAMSPSALQKWANSDAAKGIRAGFEAELIFRDTTNDDDDDGDMEPDYDYDERARSVQGVIDFFNGGDFGGLGPRQESQLQDGLDEQYFEWLDERMYAAFRDEQEDLIKKVLVDEEWDEDNEIQKQLALLDLSDDEINDIINAGERAPRFTKSSEQQAYIQANPLYQKYLDAQTEAEGLLDELVQDSIRAQDKFYDAALDDFRENFYIDDDSDFFSDVGLSYMSDIASEYNLDWPYMTGSGGGNNGGSREWDEIGSSLEKTVGMPVKVSSGYHNATRKEGQWIVEPDTSLRPDDSEDFGLEIVSPPMPLLQALEQLQAVTDWANSPYGSAYTNDSTGLHMGVSVPYKGGDVDYLKLILFLGDEYVLQSFGREANSYTKSAMKKFRENIKGGRADPAGALALMQSNLIEFAYREIQKGVGTGKYTSAHIQDGYIEFRSAGGDWLAEGDAEPGKLENTMLRYARAMQIAADPSAERKEFAKKLYKLVAPEGDSQLALFSQYAAGVIDKDQLKKQWAEKTIGTERKMNQRWKLYNRATGEPVPGQEYNGYTEEEARARAKGKISPGSSDRDFDAAYELRNMSGDQQWEIYSVDTGETLEIVKGRNKGEAADAVFDKYAAQKIGFNVRPYQDPATMTPRAKLAKRIAQPKAGQPVLQNYEVVDQRDVNLRVVGRFQAQSDNAAEKYSLWLQTNNLPDDTEDYGYRKTAAQSAETEPNVAQNFEPGRQNWEIYDEYDGTERVRYRMPNATADEVQDWIAQQERAGMPPGFLRTRIAAQNFDNARDSATLQTNLQDRSPQTESIDPVSGAGAVPPRPVIKKISTDRAEPIEPVAKKQPYRSAIGQAISKKDLEDMTQQIKMARRLGDSVMEMEDTPPAVLHALDQAAQKNGYKNWADVKANPRSPQAVMNVAKLANTMLRMHQSSHDKMFETTKSTTL